MDATRQCMSDQIRHALAERIYSGKLPPGERLVELQIAREFDTSQTPVREAFRELEALRLVESNPYRGTRVREVSPREMAEAYLVRGVLEQLAAELAAPLVRGKVETLRDALGGIAAGAKAGDAKLYAAENLKFHRWIVEAADNRMLLQSWEALSFETRIGLSVARSSPQELLDRIQIHIDIANALDVGDGQTAGLLLRHHSHGLTSVWKDREANPVEPATMSKVSTDL
jgi:DNA-binding GntR family transcriptional regulator